MGIIELRKKANTLDAVIRIGKNGLSENLLAEFDRHLKKKKLVKAKILNNCEEDKDKLIDDIINKSNCILVSRVGNVFTLYRGKV